MKISAIQGGISFGRELRPDEIPEFESVRDRAKQITGQTGKSIFIVHDACLPQKKAFDTGLGNLSSKDSKDFFKYMKTYLGFNTVEVLPAGEVGTSTGLYCAYSGSALSLGNHQINPLLLTTKEYEKILKCKEFDKIVSENEKANLPDWQANYPNVMPDDSPQDKALRIAYERFKKLPENKPLKKDFEKFVSENDDWLIPKGIFKGLMKQYGTYKFWTWADETDKNLYNPDFDELKRLARIADLKEKYSGNINFVRFKQFIAERHLLHARKELNAMGIELKGDCEIGFSADEKWANPKAFMQNGFIGTKDWGIAALDYDSLLADKNSSAAKFLKKKVQLCARRYDSIRFDVGWAYVNPKIYDKNNNCTSKYLGDGVLTFIENAVKEVKGDDYDLKNLIWEFDGGDIFKPNSGELLEPVKSRVKVYGSTFMHEKNGDCWGSNDAFLKRGWKPDEFVIGVGNHDPQPLRQIANNVKDITLEEGNQYHKADSIPPLARILKLDPQVLQNPVEFAKAKWAEPMTAKNNEMFYMDVFGREERFDMQGFNLSMHPERNYAYKIPENYGQIYHEAVREGYAFNIMDSLEKVFKARGFDKKYPELYAKIVHYNKVLNKREIPHAKSKFKYKHLTAAGITIAVLGAVLFGAEPKLTESEKSALSAAAHPAKIRSPQIPVCSVCMTDFLA